MPIIRFRPKTPKGRMQYAPTAYRWMGFAFRHMTYRETRRVLDFATRHSVKPGGFWTLPHDMAQNPAGFGLRHTT